MDNDGFGKFAKENLPLTLAVLFFLINSVGVSFNYAVFYYHGYNYSDFAEASDFVVSSFKSPLALMYAFFPALFGFAYMQRNFNNLGRNYFFLNLPVGILGSFFVAPFVLGYIAALAGLSSVVLGAGSHYSKFFCQAPDLASENTWILYGQVVSVAGDFLLIKNGFGSNAFVLKKECITLIAPYSAIISDHLTPGAYDPFTPFGEKLNGGATNVGPEAQ